MHRWRIKGRLKECASLLTSKKRKWKVTPVRPLRQIGIDPALTAVRILGSGLVVAALLLPVVRILPLPLTLLVLGNLIFFTRRIVESVVLFIVAQNSAGGIDDARAGFVAAENFLEIAGVELA